MTDRLQTLLRQRALIQEHLAWLDHKIADASGAVQPPSTSIPPPLPASVAPLPAFRAATTATSGLSSNDAAAAAEKILGKYSVDSKVAKTDARRGCLFVFSIFFGLFLLVVGVCYYFYGRHLGRWW